MALWVCSLAGRDGIQRAACFNDFHWSSLIGTGDPDAAKTDGRRATLHESLQQYDVLCPSGELFLALEISFSYVSK